MAVWLQRGGYYTVHLGKFLNGYGQQNPTEIPAGWSEWHGAVDPTTYRYYNYTLNEGGTLHTFCATPQPSCYQTDVYRDKANEIIRRRAAQGPFFLWVAFLGDHSGAPREPDDPPQLATPVPAPRHHDALKGTPLPQPANFNEADVSDKPRVIRQRPLLNARRIAAIQENWQQRRETLMSVDEAVASIVDVFLDFSCPCLNTVVGDGYRREPALGTDMQRRNTKKPISRRRRSPAGSKARKAAEANAATLQDQVAALTRELKEAREQQAGT